MISWLNRRLKSALVSAFHVAYYDSRDTWLKNTFLGYPLYQNPLDLQTYQELIFRTAPPCIIQTGIADGGSLLYFASLFDLMHAPASSEVIGVDIQLTPNARKLSHPRIRMIVGDSTDPAVLAQVRGLVGATGGMVVLDSDHTKAHVLKELGLYAELVAAGAYLVVEDTNVNGHPVNRRFGEGPFEAVEEFLARDKRFIRDDGLWKRQLFSFHQYGWLQRVE